MKRIFRYKFALLFLLVFPFSVFGQSNEAVEKELVSAIKDLQKYSIYGDGHDDENLSKAQKAFEEKLLKHTKTASTLQYKFPELDESLFIATSDDGKFRIYSWDLEHGGTMHDYARVYQYQAADGKVYSKTDEPKEEGGVGSFVQDIFTLDTSGGTVYIVCSTFIGSTQDHSQAARLFKIEGGKLVDEVKLIKTNSGLTHTLGFGYNFFSVVDREERPVRLISFDKKTKTLKIPVVIEDEEFPNGRVTGRFISYKFDGKYFVKVK